MTTDDELIGRLRNSAKAYRGMLHDAHANDCEEAASELQSQSDRIAVLEGEKMKLDTCALVALDYLETVASPSSQRDTIIDAIREVHDSLTGAQSDG